MWRVWVQYAELSSRRTYGQPISWTEIAAWAKLTGRRLSPRDVMGFDAIESAYFRVLREQKND